VAIKLNIGTLNDGSQQIELVSDAKEIGLDDKLLKGNLLIYIEFFKATHQLDLNVKVSGIMNLVCDRCLDAYETPFESAFEIVFVQKADREEAINDDYIRTYSPFMKTVDITNDIREYVLLSVPMRKIPAKTQEGVCTWCGKTEDYWKTLIKDEET